MKQLNTYKEFNSNEVTPIITETKDEQVCEEVPNVDELKKEKEEEEKSTKESIETQI